MGINGVLKKLTIASIAGSPLVVGGTAASAIVEPGSFSATCDPAVYGYSSDNRYHHHDSSYTTISVKNNGSSRTATTRLYRSNGVALHAQNLASGETKNWGSAVASGYYRVDAKSASSANCNGASPGKGNFTFKYKITF